MFASAARSIHGLAQLVIERTESAEERTFGMSQKGGKRTLGTGPEADIRSIWRKLWLARFAAT